MRRLPVRQKEKYDESEMIDVYDTSVRLSRMYTHRGEIVSSEWNMISAAIVLSALHTMGHPLREKSCSGKTDKASLGRHCFSNHHLYFSRLAGSKLENIISRSFAVSCFCSCHRSGFSYSAESISQQHPCCRARPC